jgi:hypothetical protein
MSPSVSLVAKPAVKRRLIELNDGQEYGYLAMFEDVLDTNFPGVAPKRRQSLYRVISRNTNCKLTLAAALIRILEDDLTMPQAEVRKHIDKWFDPSPRGV